MDPIQIFDTHPLFEDVQMNRVFPDSKTFVDCIPRQSLDAINQEYQQAKDGKGFDLRAFVRDHFDMPKIYGGEFQLKAQRPLGDHIADLWKLLTRQPDAVRGSLIPLPNPYVVPGGRFGEIYYWDSYFTMLGLEVSGQAELLESMLRNFSFLIDEVGYIPNGNRTYYIGRSQPPFFAMMVSLLAGTGGSDILREYLPALEKEYAYWMKGKDQLNEQSLAQSQVVRMPGGEILNRYYDDHDTPRPEAFREDSELAAESGMDQASAFHHLRSGAASGWDFSSRWFRDGRSFGTIHCSDIIPVDLNCLLYFQEQLIAEAHGIVGNEQKVKDYAALAMERKHAIQKYCWDEEQSFYFDFDFSTGSRKTLPTLAAAFPLYLKIADKRQAEAVAARLEKEFMCEGGLVTTLQDTGQQWDWPNGWAPLQWVAIVGLEQYGHDRLAKEIANRWIKLNVDVYNRTGKLMEKYNVIDTQLEAGGGEYPGQDGFGWTIGVLLALMKNYNL